MENTIYMAQLALIGKNLMKQIGIMKGILVLIASRWSKLVRFSSNNK